MGERSVVRQKQIYAFRGMTVVDLSVSYRVKVTL